MRTAMGAICCVIGLFVERRLMRHQGQLMLDKHAEQFGQRLELAVDPRGRAALAVEPGTEPLVQFLVRGSLDPCGERKRLVVRDIPIR